jgi:hypothetical protein
MLDGFSERRGGLRRFFLSDEQLWRAIAKNTTELSNLMDQEVQPVENGAGSRARLIEFNKLQREYRVYTAELRRRYS